MKKSNTVILAFPGHEDLTGNIASETGSAIGEFEHRRFPDGESYIRIETEVKGKDIILLADLHEPDAKFLPLYFLVKTAKEHGCGAVTLIAPYLAYMRQDKEFHTGEGITSLYFGDLLSEFIDALITVDPHLHRWKSLSDIYSINTVLVHSAKNIASWIATNISDPLLIGPDGESEQWVSEVADLADVPYIVLEKVRLGDNNVEIKVPDIESFKGLTPVLLDDIISTAGTMSSVVRQLIASGLPSPVCIGVHAIFAGNAYQDLKEAGASMIVTCNTIKHETNKIDISNILVEGLEKL